MSEGDRLSVAVVAEQLRRRVPGGIGTYALGLLQGVGQLAEAERPELLVVASRPGRGRDPLAATGWPVEAARLPGKALTRLWDAGLCRVGVGEVVHAVSMLAPAPKYGQPLSAVVHDLAFRSYPDAFTERGRRWHEASLHRLARRADAVVVPSAETAAALVASGVEIAPERIVVIAEGADHLPEPDDKAATAVLDRLGVHSPFLLSVSTLEPRKNLPRLVEGYGRARPDLPGAWPLVVVGPPGWSNGAAPARDVDGVVFAGRVEPSALAALYGRARCVAYVPLEEGFGLPVVEAMAHGAPVVASKVPSAGGAALAIDPLDAASIADGLVAAASDGPERERLVAAGAERAAGLRWVDAARAHVELWAGLRAKAGR